MIIFLYGEDSFRLKQKLEQIKKKAKELVFVDNFANFQEQIKTDSLFGVKKVIIISKLSPEFNDTQDSENNIIVFCDEKPDKRTKLFKKLKQIASVEEFNFLNNQEIISWIRENANISFSAANKLSAYIGTDLWQISNELEKLKAYAGYKNLILDKHVESLVKANFSTDIFKTISSDKKLGLKLLHEHLAQGDDEAYLFNMLIYQFRNILKIKTGQTSGMHPFVIQKTRSIAQKYSLKDFETIFSLFLKLDLWSKTSRCEQPATFFLLLSQI